MREGVLVLDHDAPVPEAPAGEALVRVESVSLGQREARVVRGGIRFEGIIGSAGVGVVERVHVPGDATSALRKRSELLGERVAWAGSVSCNVCDMCRGGLGWHCRSRSVMGVRGRDGCLSEHTTVPLMGVLRVPEGVDADRAALASMIAPSVRATEWAGADGRSMVTVIGTSALGAITAQILARSNKAVRLLSDDEQCLTLCERWGVRHRRTGEAGRRMDQDVVVECSGTPDGMRLALQHVRPRGTIVVLGDSTRPVAAGQVMPESDDDSGFAREWVVSNEVSVVGVREGSLADALGVIARAEADLDAIVGQRVPFEQAGPAIGQIASGTTWQPAVVRVHNKAATTPRRADAA